MAASKLCTAFVRSIDNETHLTISFILNNKLHRLYRPKHEPVDKTLKRLSLSMIKKNKKKDKGAAQNDTPPAISIHKMTSMDIAIPSDTPNELAWQPGAALIIDGTHYIISMNYPQVIKLDVPDLVMVGCPIVPQVEVEFASKDCCQWEWRRITDENVICIMESEEMELASLDSSYSPSYWADSEHLNNSAIYWPTIEDLNRTLVLKCTPYDPSTNRYGNPVYCYTPGVESGPQLMSIRKRQEMTPFLLPHGSMRVISYNILADQHATTDYSRDILYPYCSQEALSSPYRHGLLVNELIGYNADIVCLQEVAMKSFDVSLLPVLNEQGYDGHYAMKTGQLHEGEAIFFHTSKYTSISSHVISLRKFFSEDPECAELFIELQKAPVIVMSIMDKPTILQVVVLQVTGYNERYLVVANTHLSFHPSEDHIRLFQAILCTKAINKIIREFKDFHLTSCDVAVIFCGDFNSCPCTGGYEYLTKGFLPACHPDWTKYKYSLIPRCGCCKVPTSDQDYIINALAMTEEKNLIDPSSVVIIDDFKGIDIKHELSLQDACGPSEYTHYRNVFVAVLDYILTDTNYFTVSNVVSMPTHDEVTQHTALPSVCFPSDHLALICELTWKVNI